jgi:GTPase
MFIDEIKINVKSGDGGNGCISTHREIYKPLGGPNGGNGGRGGSIMLEGTTSMNTLNVFKKRVHIKGNRGEHGRGKNQHGKDAEDTIVLVPLGTVVYDSETGRVIGDIVREGQRLAVAKGGRGGRGNAAFATPNYRVPRFAERGERGEERWIKLELRTIAHVGLVGFPNAGKSTFLANTTAAKPKIADYPFTTLSPNLGVYEKGYGKRYIFADIPGLIEGASQGTGLGDKFLRHISRTKMLIHLIDLTTVNPDKPLENYEIIMRELKNYSPALIEKPMLVAGNKTDVAGTEEAFFALEKALQDKDIKCFAISAASGEGMEELLEETFRVLDTLGEEIIVETPEPEEELVIVDETTEDLRQFTIEHEDGVYRVRGKNPERMVQMTDLENEEGLYHLQQRLKRMGIDERLKKMGARDGDTVVIGDYEFEYTDEQKISFK